MKILELPGNQCIYHLRCSNQECSALLEVEDKDFQQLGKSERTLECPNCATISSYTHESLRLNRKCV